MFLLREKSLIFTQKQTNTYTVHTTHKIEKLEQKFFFFEKKNTFMYYHYTQILKKKRDLIFFTNNFILCFRSFLSPCPHCADLYVLYRHDFSTFWFYFMLFCVPVSLVLLLLFFSRKSMNDDAYDCLLGWIFSVIFITVMIVIIALRTTHNANMNLMLFAE